MKVRIIFLLLICSVCAVFAARIVHLDDGKVTGVGYRYGKDAIINHDKNIYTDDEWDGFGITNPVPYIIKDGSIWRDMTSTEIRAFNNQEKDEEADFNLTEKKTKLYFQALIVCINKRLPEGNKITLDELKQEARNILDQ